MAENTLRELFRAIRAGLVETLKGATSAGNKVRTGIAIPISDPFAPVIIPEDVMPFIIVGFKRIDISNNGPTGGRKWHKRNCIFQIDAFLKHDRTAAKAAGLAIDEELELRRDKITDQIMTQIEKNQRFQLVGDVEAKAELWIENSINNEYDNETENGAVIAVVSITVNAMYDQHVVYVETNDLSLINISIDDNGSIIKVLQVTAAP